MRIVNLAPGADTETSEAPAWRRMLDGAIDAAAVRWDREVERPAHALQVSLLDAAAALVSSQVEAATVAAVAADIVPTEPVVEPVAEVAPAEPAEPAEPVAEPAVEPVAPAPAPKPKRVRKPRARKSKIKTEPAAPPSVDPEIPAVLAVGIETPADAAAPFWDAPADAPAGAQ
jgi:outer membrane biosynthesis protein TonB